MKRLREDIIFKVSRNIWNESVRDTTQMPAFVIALCVRETTLVPSSRKIGCMLEVLAPLMMTNYPHWKIENILVEWGFWFKIIELIDNNNSNDNDNETKSLSLNCACSTAQRKLIHYIFQMVQFQTSSNHLSVHTCPKSGKRITRFPEKHFSYLLGILIIVKSV